MARLRFSHVALNCLDPASIERFYTRNFGFRRARSIPLNEGEIVFLKCGQVYLELFAAVDTEAGSLPAASAGSQARPARPASGDGPHWQGVRHLAFQVDDVDAQLLAMGDEAVVTLGPLDFDAFIPGWRTVWLSDPEGNVVEISQGYRDQPQRSLRAAGANAASVAEAKRARGKEHR